MKSYIYTPSQVNAAIDRLRAASDLCMGHLATFTLVILTAAPTEALNDGERLAAMYERFSVIVAALKDIEVIEIGDSIRAEILGGQ